MRMADPYSLMHREHGLWMTGAGGEGHAQGLGRVALSARVSAGAEVVATSMSRGIE